MLPSLLAILLLEGFITVSVEVLTIRQLLPFFGGSVIITSLIIGFFLLSLAIGYWRGGFRRHDFFRQLSYNFLFAFLWIGIGLSYSFITVFSQLLISNLGFTYLTSLTIYLLLILAPIAYWLGQTIPITTNLFNQNKGISRISGLALFLSTIGSFLGAVITSLILFQFAGVAWTIVFICALLFCLVLFLETQTKLSFLRIIGLVILLWLIKITNVDMERSFFIAANNYANYQVKTLDKSRYFIINHSNSSMLTTDKKTHPYIELMRQILFEELKLKHKSILVIGAGGFSLTAEGANDNEVIYVDIDPDIKELAEKYFLNAKIKGKFVGQDARLFLNQSKASFDVIISDVYSHQISIPASLLTVEYFKKLRDHLNPSGLLMVNLIANPLFKDKFSQRFYASLQAVFGYCSVMPLSFKDNLSNIVFVCPNLPASHSVYTDNLNRSTMDFYNSI